jgi:RNA polymerase sigma factor (sigma-70 family)
MTAVRLSYATVDEPDDAELIRRSFDAPEQFAGLFDRYAAELQGYAARRLGTSTADDIVAETFLIAFSRRGRYDLTRPLARPWLFGIATRLIARHRRREVRLYRALARSGVDPLADRLAEPPDDLVVARVAAQAQQRALAAALARLPRGWRDVLLLVAWGELTYDEVAQALGIPVGTVRSRLHRTRAQVRAALAMPVAREIAEDNSHG